jgi:signal transduction histidine kinase
MSVVEPAGTVPGDELNPADHAQATRNVLGDFAEEGQQLKDTQLALLNILEDATLDRLRAEEAVKASLNILEDLSDAQAQIRTLNVELEARVELRTAELMVANKNLEAFTYSVAHDLRSPLRALSGYGEALTEDYGDRLDETGRWFIERIQAAAERMGALIDDLLVLAGVSRSEMNLEPVDLSTEVAAIAGELQAGEPGRRVRFAIQDGVWVNADRALIRTVLQNLVENAWKYTGKRDGGIIEFGTTAAEDEDEDAGVCCYLRDNGSGFDPAFTGKLFQPFQRLHPVTEFPGTGIGLASVRRIVERHGGRAWAEGAVGRGATFYFTLDAKQAPSGPSTLYDFKLLLGYRM